MKNIYYEKLQKELQHYVDDFIRLQTATLAQLQLDFDTLKNPQPTMEKTFRQSVERAYRLKGQMIEKGRQLLNSEKSKLAQINETSVLAELKKLNAFNDFQNRLLIMTLSELRSFSDDDTLSKTEVFQIKAELVTRKKNAKSDIEREEIDNIIQNIHYVSPDERIEDAVNALEQLKTDKNIYPFLPAHLAVDNNIPRLLGSEMLSALDGDVFFGEVK